MKKIYFSVLGLLAIGSISSLAYLSSVHSSSSKGLPIAKLSPTSEPVELFSASSQGLFPDLAMQGGWRFVINSATIPGVILQDGLWDEMNHLSYLSLIPLMTIPPVSSLSESSLSESSLSEINLPPNSFLGTDLPPLKPVTTSSRVASPSTALLNTQIPPLKPVNQTARNAGAPAVKPNASTSIAAVKPSSTASSNNKGVVQPSTNVDPQYHGKVRVSMIPYTGAAFANAGVVWEVYQNDPVTKTVSTQIFARTNLAQYEFSLPAGNYIVRAHYNSMTADLLVPVQEKHVYQYILNFYAGQTRLVADFANHSENTQPVSWEIRPRSDTSRIVASGSGHDSVIPLREGNYLVFAKSGTLKGQAPLEIRAGQTKQVNVTLQASN